MKRILLMMAGLACGLTAWAQTSASGDPPAQSRNFALEVTGGYAAPVGTFASGSKTDKKAGYATGGWLVQVACDWMGKKYLGLGLQYVFQHNPMKNAATYAWPYGDASLDAAEWNNHSIMAGPVFRKKFDRWLVDAKLLGGFLFAASPAFETPDPADTTGHSIHSNVGTGFTFQLSAGAGYRVTPHLALRLSVNLTGGWPSKTREYAAYVIGYEWWKDPETGLTYQKPVYSAPRQYEISKVIMTLTPAIGLVYDF